MFLFLGQFQVSVVLYLSVKVRLLSSGIEPITLGLTSPSSSPSFEHLAMIFMATLLNKNTHSRIFLIFIFIWHRAFMILHYIVLT